MINILGRFKKTKNTDDKQKMGMMQSLAMKKAMNMSPKEREKVISEAMRPENREKLEKTIKMMEKMGVASKDQIEAAKKQLGL